ncbi:FOXN3 family protein [Megaselia abdita]
MSPERATQYNSIDNPSQRRIVEIPLPEIITRKTFEEHILVNNNEIRRSTNFVDDHNQAETISELTITSTPESIITGNDLTLNNKNIIIYKDKTKKLTSDEELTNLTWLQDKNFIRGIVQNGVYVMSKCSPTTPTKDKFENNNSIIENENLSALGVTTTMHKGPSGTTTVIEYSPNSNFTPSVCLPQTLPAQYTYKISPTSISTTSKIKECIPIQTLNQKNTIIYSTKPVESPTPTHHPHKKYIREQMNAAATTTVAFENTHFIGPSGNNNQIDIDSLKSIQTVISAPSTPTSTNSEHLRYVDIIHRSPSTYSSHSQETDSMKDFDTKPYNNKMTPQKISPSGGMKQKITENYDPKVNVMSKPPYSFSSLIFMAIEDSPEKALPVKEIYAWIVTHFPFFKTAPSGWKNSVRHNLSLNKSFVKIEKAPNMGKGSLWRVEPSQRSNQLQSLSRCPFYSGPNHFKSIKPESEMGIKTSQLDSNLFPKLSKKMIEIEKNRKFEKPSCLFNDDYEDRLDESFTDNLDDVKAATAMLALKHGAKVFNRDVSNSFPVITISPSADHTYSAGGNLNELNSNVSFDTSYESTDDSHNISLQEIEEQKRQKDGVDALLSLSKMFDISPIKRPASNTVEEEHISSYMDNITHVHAIC